MAKVLIIDDEKAILKTLEEILKFEGFDVDVADGGLVGLEKLKEQSYDVCFCDIKMPDKDGLEVLKEAKDEGIDAEFIMISAHGTIETAVEATKIGAFDFLEKPPDLNRILVTLRNALDKGTLKKETKTLKKRVSRLDEIIGEGEAIAHVKEMIEKVAPSEARVLITGPNGSGKELVARGIHKNSERKKAAFIEVNCAAIPSELIESELFGHEKGSFTSAVKQRIGKFEQANGGTLFLDEIGDMSASAQAKVLRALQEKKITRVGGEKEISVDVRVLAATNKDLKKEIEEGRFREDLYHRLGVILIKVPPLKERSEDIESLVHHFLDLIAAEYGQPIREIEKSAIDFLSKQSWTGNIRELRNVVERLIIMCPEKITLEESKLYIS